MNRVFVLCLAAAVAAAMGGGSLAGSGNGTPTPDAKNVTEFTDPARPIAVAPGDKFVITLVSNRSTGFAWRLAKPSDEKVVRLEGSEYSPGRADLDGAPGKEAWTFTAVAAGQTTISLKYVRPWEKNKPPLKEATFTIAVRSETEP
jgi:inhibitor of cysteine peptidase